MFTNKNQPNGKRSLNDRDGSDGSRAGRPSTSLHGSGQDIMASMDLIDAREALDQAVAARLSQHQATWLAGACSRRSAKLGPAGIRGHSIAYDPGKWHDLPFGDGSISRGEVFDLSGASAADVFTASYVFGMGKRGYGRSRYDKIRSGAPHLGRTLEQVREIGLGQGPIFAYAQLYGGPDYDRRTRPGTLPWSRIASYGPAFFTKFLYFTVPGALILDARLAARVARLTGNESGYLKNGRPVAWTPFRYAVYLHWMRQAAIDVSRHAVPHTISAELIELTLFDAELADLPLRTENAAAAAVPDENDDGDAAD
ncbi:hypothetical protein [Actinoplanes sp. HUAS TT8]|uniref:8-oxoguanine DNA glycosylase OGG fold protein n=1 Tax=Actinoplanes sp. HUAS TT8 TaxID=3447453 RepID=UPI003F5290B8